MRAVILILLCLLLSLNAKALAVASDYLEDNTLALVEGTSKIYSIRLQNPDSFESRVKIDYDRQYMKAMDFKEEYILPPKSSTRIEFNVTAPNYNKNNNKFVVSYTVHQLTAPSGGGIPFLTKINKNFKLKVEKNPNKLHAEDFFKLAYSITLLAISFFILKSLIKKKHNKKVRR
jgi:hypothetical protein